MIQNAGSPVVYGVPHIDELPRKLPSSCLSATTKSEAERLASGGVRVSPRFSEAIHLYLVWRAIDDNRMPVPLSSPDPRKDSGLLVTLLGIRHLV